MSLFNEVRPTSTSHASSLIAMVRAYQISQALHAAATFRVADHMAQGARHVEDIARACGAHSEALHRLLRALASREVFAMLGERSYGLTPMSELMRTDVPGSVHGQLLLWGHPMQWSTWGHIAHSVRTGCPAFEQVHGTDHWRYLAQDESAGQMFERAMAAHPSHLEFAEAVDLSQTRSLVDIGGGGGRLLTHLLRSNLHLRGCLLERPLAADAAEANLREAGFAARSTVVRGDFFADIPAGADAYVLSNVLMDWGDSETADLLRGCRAAMHADAQLHIVERMLPSDNAAHVAQLSDLMGLVVTGGRTRSVQELSALLRCADLHMTSAITTASGYGIVTARCSPGAIHAPR